MYKRNKQFNSTVDEVPSSALGTPSVRYNHFLQYSLIDAGNVYRKEGNKYKENPNGESIL